MMWTRYYILITSFKCIQSHTSTYGAAGMQVPIDGTVARVVYKGALNCISLRHVVYSVHVSKLADFLPRR